MRILLVDDDEISLAITQNALCEAGHEVEVALDGRDGLELMRTNPCRIVISDWEMPEMNGLELCRAIRAADLPSYTYIILLTSRGSTQDVVDGMSAGADDFITKPFEPEELRVRIRAGERVLSLETRDMAIFAMAKLADSRDPETGAHLDRIRSYARILADELANHEEFRDEIDADFNEMIYATSPLHDIGKIGIPDSVLLNPGRLTDEEFDIMKTHTTIGAETLDAAIHQYSGVDFLLMARDIALTHHERYDGTGYPRGLAGEDIRLCGRIVSVDDVYDALRSKRVYKESFSQHIARHIILEGRGTQFDPRFVDAFVARSDDITETHDRFAESAMASHAG